MQHDVCLHPVPRRRFHVPFVAVIQSDLAETDDVLVGPILSAPVPRDIGGPLIPVLVEGRWLRLDVSQLYPLHRQYLRRPVGTVAPYRDDILRALDWLFTGL